MNNPFNEKDERGGSTVYQSSLNVTQSRSNGSNNRLSELAENRISASVTQTAHNMMAMVQDSRVVLPALMTNSHDQGGNQEGMNNEMVQEMNSIYPQLDSGNMQSVLLTYPSQRMDDDGSTPLEVDDGMKGVMDISEDGKKRLDNTLVGRIVDIMQRENRPMVMDQILDQIGDNFDELRKADGTKYKGDRAKAINGALYSTGIFRHTDDKWSLRPNECQAYQHRMQQKLDTKGKKKRNTATISDNNEEQVYVKRKYTKRQIKRGTVVKLLKSVSDRLRMNSRDQNAIYFKNPFQGFAGNEDLMKIRKKLGDEKFEMAIQMYTYFEDIFSKAVTDSEGNLEVASGNDEQTNKVINQMQQEVYELKSRLILLEKVNGLSADISI